MDELDFFDLLELADAGLYFPEVDVLFVPSEKPSQADNQAEEQQA